MGANIAVTKKNDGLVPLLDVLKETGLEVHKQVEDKITEKKTRKYEKLVRAGKPTNP